MSSWRITFNPLPMTMPCLCGSGTITPREMVCVNCWHAAPAELRTRAMEAASATRAPDGIYAWEEFEQAKQALRDFAKTRNSKLETK